MIETEQEFRPDNITINLMWSQEIHDNFQIPVSYRVSIQSVMKATVRVTMVDSTWVNISLLYNTLYNVSVVADFCGHTNTTILMEVYYGKYNRKMEEFKVQILRLSGQCHTHSGI